MRRMRRRTNREKNATRNYMLAMIQDDSQRERYARDFPELPTRIRRPVDGKPVAPSEHQLQRGVITWWGHACKGYALPEFSLFAIPNGGARDVITGALLKAEGVRRGVVDLFLACPVGPYRGLFLEMKSGKNRPNGEQEAFMAYVKEVGYEASVHWSSES